MIGLKYDPLPVKGKEGKGGGGHGKSTWATLWNLHHVLSHDDLFLVVLSAYRSRISMLKASSRESSLAMAPSAADAEPHFAPG